MAKFSWRATMALLGIRGARVEDDDDEQKQDEENPPPTPPAPPAPGEKEDQVKPEGEQEQEPEEEEKKPDGANSDPGASPGEDDQDENEDQDQDTPGGDDDSPDAEKDEDAMAKTPATVAQLREAFPGDELATFREECLAKGLSLTEAKIARCEQLEKENKALREENDKLKAVGGESPGEERPVGPGGSGGGCGAGLSGPGRRGQTHPDQVAFWRKVEEVKRENKGMQDHEAITQVVHKFPDLHEKFLAASKRHRKLV